MLKQAPFTIVMLCLLYWSCGRDAAIEDSERPKKNDNALEQKEPNSDQGTEPLPQIEPPQVIEGQVPTFQNIVNPATLQRSAQTKLLSRAELPAVLNGFEEFYNHKNDVSYSCISEVLSRSTQVIGGRDRLIFSGNYVGSNCNNELSAQAGSQVQFRVLSVIECQGVDFSQYHNRPYAEVKNIDETRLCNGKDIHFTTQSSYSFQLNQQSGTAGQTQTVNAVISHNSVVWSNGQFCTWNFQGQGFLLMPGCQITSNTSYQNLTFNGQPDPTRKLDTFLNITPQNLIKTDSISPFFAQGQLQFEINNWRGQMNYLNPQSPPQWSVSSGQEMSSGVLGR